MQVELIYNNISDFICKELYTAKESIVLCTPLFDNIEILKALIVRKKNQCEVNIIVADRPENNKFFNDVEKLIHGKPNVRKVPLSEAWILEDSFCIIDDKALITGSFSCYKKYSDSDDYLIINYKNSVFNTPFKQHAEQLMLLENQHEAISENTPQAESTGVQQWQNSRIGALKLQLSNYENQFRAFDIEKMELNKVLVDFNHQHTMELGDLIMDILELKTELLKDEEALKEAQEDKDAYEENYNAEINKDIIDLDQDDRRALKKLFREATILCHPDKFSNASKEVQDQAEEIFKALNDANAMNDIDTVKELLKRLKVGFLSMDNLAIKDSVEFYQGKINMFRDKLHTIIDEVFAIKHSETYLTITEIDDWDNYFTAMKASLQEELEVLQRI
jgi:hypothetical protein